MKEHQLPKILLGGALVLLGWLGLSYTAPVDVASYLAPNTESLVEKEEAR